MTKVCFNSTSAIYDNGDSWVWRISGQKDEIYPKSEMPLLPLSAVVKFEMRTANAEIMDNLRNIAMTA